jgi:hypothetical protein
MGHSRPGRASSKSGHVHYAADTVEKVFFGVCTENVIRVDDVMESPKLAQ